MASKSSIEWTGHTWNPIAGCSVLSPGCTNCYAMKVAARLSRIGQPLYKDLTKTSKAGAVWTGEMRKAARHVLFDPLHRKKPTTYFVNSMSDLFHENVPDAWIDEIFAVMALCPQHTFQVLTKRAERMRDYLGDPQQHNRMELAAERIKPSEGKAFSPKHVLPRVLSNVWLGVSTERQQEAEERIPFLLQTPAIKRFISAEPLLGHVDIRLWMQTIPALDWVIVGGESGPQARPMHPDWARSLRDQCRRACVPFFFKQWGAWKNGSDFIDDESVKAVCTDGRVIASDIESIQNADRDDPVMRRNPTLMRRVGKKAAGRLLDGVEHNAMPAHGRTAPTARCA